MNPGLARLDYDFGIHFPEATDFLRPEFAHDSRLAFDAQPALATVSNAGIPAFLSTIIDPRVTDVLVAPMKAAAIIGEAKKGDWTTDVADFLVVEYAGETSSYGDYSANGIANANVNFVARQQYRYQTNTVWGELEAEKMGLAKLDWVGRKNISSALILNKFQNKSYFFGIAGLQNYGLLNDPSLFAAITPIAKTGGGFVWSAASTADEVYRDIQNLVSQLILQANGLVDTETSMVLAMAPQSSVALNKTTSFNVNVMDNLKKNFPNMRIETAVEYAVANNGLSGNLVQLIAPEVEGQRTADACFGFKMRGHGIVKAASSWAQKKSGGTFGSVIYQPWAIAQLLGV